MRTCSRCKSKVEKVLKWKLGLKLCEGCLRETTAKNSKPE